MPLNRTTSFVAIGFLFCLLATPSFGQGPLGFQIFAPADVSTYGGDQQPNEGYFFQFDGLYWSVPRPRVSTIGFPGTRKVFYGTGGIDLNDPVQVADLNVGTDFRIQSNTLDTSGFGNKFSPGLRIEFGHVYDRGGWFVSIYELRDQSQTVHAGGGDIVFDDPQFGLNGERLLQGNVNNDATTSPAPYNPPVFRDLPVTFTSISIENEIKSWGVEANYLHRLMTSHAGGTFEMFVGARYFEFDDTFLVSTGVDPSQLRQSVFRAGTTFNAGVPSFLGGSVWDTTAQNHIVGPQIGMRWFKKEGRWTFSTEGRFMAGLNCQNVEQQVDMGPQLSPGPKTIVIQQAVPQNATLPPDLIYHYQPFYVYQPFQPRVMSHVTATNVEYAREFSPTVELRLEGRYEVTRAISFHAGWTGMWMNGIARGSSLVEYQVPAMGIDMNHNREDVFVQGLTLGFDVNR
jgi:hypothetical protein